MKRLTTLLLALLFVFASYGQRVLTYDGKVLTYGSKVLTYHFEPADIVGLEFWFDGQDAATFSLNGNKVIQWDDKSGYDRHVSNAVDAQRPTYDPITDRVTFMAANSTYLQLANFAAPLVQPNTIFVLYKITGNLASEGYVFDAGALIIAGSIYHSVSVFRINAGNQFSDGATNANDNIHCAEFNGATSNYWINGILVAGPGDAGNRNLDGITLGAYYNLTKNASVEIMEVFGYNRSLSEVERTQLTNYLQDKWDLSLWLIILLIPNIRRKFKIAA